VGANRAAGTVTSVNVASGTEATVGTILYTVDLRPVAVALGVVPAFRTMAQDTSGEDVSQLQAMLATLGYYSGATNGIFGWSTRKAVISWQKSTGLPTDGVVQIGDIVFARSLPMRISLDSELLSVGAILNGSEAAIRGLPVAPTFTAPVTAAQSAAIANGSRIEVTGPAGTMWTGEVVERITTADGDIVLTISGDSGGDLCASECESLPTEVESLLQAKVVIVEPTAGLTVPSAALRTLADGTVVVIDSKGKQHAVTVEASAKGYSVLGGAAAGMMVRVPAGP